MAGFKSIVTNLGVEFLTRAIAENKQIIIDTVKVGNGRFTGNHKELTDIISPITIHANIGEREFIEQTQEQSSLLKINVQITNKGLISKAFVREIGLYARYEDENEQQGILFAYSYLVGEDTDNIIPLPVIPDFPDTSHIYGIALFISNQQNSNITVTFDLDAFVTYKTMTDYVTEASGGLLIQNISDRIGFYTDIANSLGNTIFGLIKFIVTKFTSVWTDTRATRVDNLDTTISSRAPANTALTNAVWTNARAGYLDRLNSGIPITSIPSVVKSVQRGVVTGQTDTSGNPTLTHINISTVNPAKCMLIIDNSLLSNVNGMVHGAYAVSFTSTSIGFYGNALVTARPFSWQLIEFI